MQISDAIRSVELCALRHLSINTEKAYTHWLGRYGTFLKDPDLHLLSSEQKMEAFLTRLALLGASASTQNQPRKRWANFSRSSQTYTVIPRG
jgi:hypothetical protein